MTAASRARPAERPAPRERKERLSEVARRVRDDARREAGRVLVEGEVPAGGE